MRRHGETGRPGKRQRTNKPKARKASSVLASIANLQEQLDERTHERDEALEQWTATTEVLTVISRSTFDLQNVLATLVRSAGRLCRAENVQIFLRDGEVYRLAADNGFSPEYQQYVREHPITPGRNTLVARTVLEGKTVHIADALADSEYAYGGQKIAGYRTLLGIPLVRDGNCVGAIALTRSKVRPFTDKQVELVRNFANQAVIAIENTRLLNELRESLEQQTASADVLRIISSSGTLERVFETILENATRICEANFGNLFRFDGEKLHPAAQFNTPTALVDALTRRGPFKPTPGISLDCVIRTKKLFHSVIKP